MKTPPTRHRTAVLSHSTVDPVDIEKRSSLLDSMTLPSAQLFDLLTGRIASSFLLLEDSPSINASVLLWPCMSKAVCEKYSCLVVQCQLNGTPCQNLPPSVSSINLFDYTDSLSCLQAVREHISLHSAKPYAVFFDKIDNLLLDLDLFKLASLLTLVSTHQNVATQVCVIQLQDEEDEDTMDVLKYCATTRLRLLSCSSQSGSNLVSMVGEFLHRRTMGSVLKSVQYPFPPPSNRPAISDLCRIIIDPTTMTIVSCCGESQTVPSLTTGSSMSLPSSTFKFSLSSTEMKDRGNVILPYKAATLTDGDIPTISMPGEGKINYNPDCFDDLDDEDPDEDLDI